MAPPLRSLAVAAQEQYDDLEKPARRVSFTSQLDIDRGLLHDLECSASLLQNMRALEKVPGLAVAWYALLHVHGQHSISACHFNA